jgi:hypothetical protein
VIHEGRGQEERRLNRGAISLVWRRLHEEKSLLRDFLNCPGHMLIPGRENNTFKTGVNSESLG